MELLKPDEKEKIKIIPAQGKRKTEIRILTKYLDWDANLRKDINKKLIRLFYWI